MRKVIHVLSDTKVGGAGKWLINFLQEVDRTRFQVKVVLPRGSLLSAYIVKIGIEVIEISSMSDCSFDRVSIGELYKIFQKEKPDIVHTHASLSARIAAKLSGNKIVFTRHCMNTKIPSGATKYFHAIMNRLLCDKAIAVAEAVKQNLIDIGVPGKKIVVIYNGVEPFQVLEDDEKQKLRKQWKIEEDEVVIGIVARLEEIKGHTYFLQAAQKVIMKNNSVKFLVVGTGSKEEELKNLAVQLDIDKNVVFTGFSNEVDQLMNIIDINVISSFSEAFGLSLIEGMSISKPCIATKTGGIPEVVKHGYTGFLVPVQDAEALTKAMDTLVADQALRNEMGDHARIYMEQHFTAKRMTQKIMVMYEELLSK